MAAFRKLSRTLPAWTDARGRRRHFIPTSLTAGGQGGDAKEESRHAFYLDAGPLFLVFAGLLRAKEPEMADTLRWFRAGPQRRFNRRDSNCWQVPVLYNEMSSCEPCYSWNVFHAYELGDRENFLEGLYSLFAGAISRKTCIGCETRGGVYGNVFSNALALYLARLAVIDDQLREDELHLLRLAPLAWLKADRQTVFDNMPTEFGPVSLRFKLSADKRKLAITFRPGFRCAPERVLLHVPPLKRLKEIVLNGKPYKCGTGSGSLLPV